MWKHSSFYAVKRRNKKKHIFDKEGDLNVLTIAFFTHYIDIYSTLMLKKISVRAGCYYKLDFIYIAHFDINMQPPQKIV